MSMKFGHSSSRRWMLSVGALAAVAGAGLAWWRLTPKASSSAQVEAFWSLRFERPAGGELKVQDLRGKPLLVNFWATWCPPCVEELPMIDAFLREHSAKGVQVLALAIDQPSSVRKFLERHPLSVPIGLAGLDGTALARSLGNSQGGLPFSVFFNANGDIYQKKLGQLTLQDMQAWVSQAV